MNSTLCDTGADLLVATQWTAVELADLQPELTLEQLTGSAGRVQLVFRQEIAVEAGPLQQVAFLVVVRDQCNVSGAWRADGCAAHWVPPVVRPLRPGRAVNYAASPSSDDWSIGRRRWPKSSVSSRRR